MIRELTTEVDRFAASLEELVGDIPPACQEKGGESVARCVRKAAKELRGGTYGAGGVHEWSDRYMSGFTSHVEKGVVTTGEVGNKKEPGLVHLLEKGHATPAGRRSRAFPHMEPAFEVMADEFIKDFERSIGEALK